MSSTDLDQETAKSADRELTTGNDTITEELTENIIKSQESIFDNYISEEESTQKSKTSEELTEKQKSQVDTTENELISGNDKTEEELTEERPSQALVRYSTLRQDKSPEDEEEERQEAPEEKKSEVQIADVSITDGFKENEDLLSVNLNLQNKDLVSESGFRLLENVETDLFGDSVENAYGEKRASSVSSMEDGRQKSVRISGEFVRSESQESRFTLSSSTNLWEMDEESVETPPPELDEDEEEIDEKQVKHAKKQDEPKIDRAMYYEMHSMFEAKHRKEKMKNNFLQARLAGYYMRRKMLYVLREQTFHVAEMQAKYEKELDALEQLSEWSEREKESNNSELYNLKQKRDAKLAHLNELFEKFQHGALEYGKSLTFDKTGKNNMDKMTERFLKRQKNQVALLAQMRLKFIKLRNQMNDKLKALDDLDNLGPGFRIMNFVQLKTDNRGLRDKLEERECELTRLRRCCQNTMQILAHMREKTAAVDTDIQQTKSDLEEVTTEYEDAREQLHCLRQSRDEVRDGTRNLRLQFGLLINRKALLDMEHSSNECEDLKEKLETIKADYNKKLGLVRAVRKNIELFQETKRQEEEKSKAEQLSVTSTL